MQHPARTALIALTLACAACSGSGTRLDAPEDTSGPPMAYTMTNASSGNSVQPYARSADGTLVKLDGVLTGGTGLGHGLENQGALALSLDGQFLYVANPGSDDLTVFQVTNAGLQLTDRVSSGGTLPVSVAEWNGIVYVLNRHVGSDTGSGPSIQGFRVSTSGRLSPLPGSNITLRATDTNAAQLAISPDGLWIVVTERAINEIDVVPLGTDGTAGIPHTESSSGGGPFGFAFSDSTHLYVSEAGGGTASAYAIESPGVLRVLSAAIPTLQKAACWIAITPDNRFVYVSNTGSSTLSSFRIANDGGLTELNSVAATTSGGSLDFLINTSGTYLSVLTTGGSIETFRIDSMSGELSPIQTLSGLPSGTNGLVGH